MEATNPNDLLAILKDMQTQLEAKKEVLQNKLNNTQVLKTVDITFGEVVCSLKMYSEFDYRITIIGGTLEQKQAASEKIRNAFRLLGICQ